MVGEWFASNQLGVHPKKTQFMLFYSRNFSNSVKVFLNNKEIERIGEDKKEVSLKSVDVHLDENLTFKSHVHMVHKSIGINAFRMRRARSSMKRNLKQLLFNGPVKPHIDYSSVVWGNLCSGLIITRK